jgi:hypothetical protein
MAWYTNVWPMASVAQQAHARRNACLELFLFSPRALDVMPRGRCREQIVCFLLLGLVDDDLDVARIATAVVEGQDGNTLLGF